MSPDEMYEVSSEQLERWQHLMAEGKRDEIGKDLRKIFHVHGAPRMWMRDPEKERELGTLMRQWQAPYTLRNILKVAAAVLVIATVFMLGALSR